MYVCVYVYVYVRAIFLLDLIRHTASLLIAIIIPREERDLFLFCLLSHVNAQSDSLAF